MSQIVGTKGFMLDEAEDHLDNNVMPPRDYRRAQEALNSERQRWIDVAGEQYATVESHLNDEVEFGVRVAEEGMAALQEEVLEPLRRGELSAKEASKRVAAMRADLNRAREELRKAMEREETTWAEVGVSPAEYQRALARRSPQIFQGGRGLLELPIYGD
jgi:hypothetical protein